MDINVDNFAKVEPLLNNGDLNNGNDDGSAANQSEIVTEHAFGIRGTTIAGKVESLFGDEYQERFNSVFFGGGSFNANDIQKIRDFFEDVAAIFLPQNNDITTMPAVIDIPPNCSANGCPQLVEGLGIDAQGTGDVIDNNGLGIAVIFIIAGEM